MEHTSLPDMQPPTDVRSKSPRSPATRPESDVAESSHVSARNDRCARGVYLKGEVGPANLDGGNVNHRAATDDGCAHNDDSAHNNAARHHHDNEAGGREPVQAGRRVGRSSAGQGDSVDPPCAAGRHNAGGDHVGNRHR
jgi:hypothetical protein